MGEEIELAPVGVEEKRIVLGSREMIETQNLRRPMAQSMAVNCRRAALLIG
jgi:hypothetical protein